MDQERLVSIQMPSSVPAINSSGEPLPGLMLMLVMRMIGRRFQLSVRMAPDERWRPISWAISRFPSRILIYSIYRELENWCQQNSLPGRVRDRARWDGRRIRGSAGRADCRRAAACRFFPGIVRRNEARLILRLRAERGGGGRAIRSVRNLPAGTDRQSCLGRGVFESRCL